jgi:hypothetical protein
VTPQPALMMTSRPAESAPAVDSTAMQPTQPALDVGNVQPCMPTAGST